MEEIFCTIKRIKRKPRGVVQSAEAGVGFGCWKKAIPAGPGHLKKSLRSQSVNTKGYNLRIKIPHQ